jgi:predicted transcriptional regulator
MTPVPFDTQKFVETLTAAGLPETQAKAISSAFREAANAEFATKSDLRDLELVIKTEMRELRDELKGDIRDLKSDMRELELRMTIKLGAMQAIGIGMLAAILKLW